MTREMTTEQMFDTLLQLLRLKAAREPIEVDCSDYDDDWTGGQADSARYRQMGNAVTVNVVEWIVKRLIDQENQ